MESEKKQRPRRTFTDEFKAGAVRLVINEGRSVTSVAKDLDLVPSALGRWVERMRSAKAVRDRNERYAAGFLSPSAT